MPVAKYATSPDNPNGWLVHYCPGCEQRHAIPIREPNHLGHVWKFNGNMEKPTLVPSVNYVGSCHYILSDGVLHFCGDCTHDLANKVVPLEPLTEDK